MNVTVKKRAVTTLISVVVLIIITILITTIIRPTHLPFVSNYIRSQLDNRFHAYYVDFDNVRTRWYPAKGVLEFHLNSARALDYGENVLATIPKVLVKVRIKSMFGDTIKLQELELQNPKISLIRTESGAIKFDLGNSDDGSSGRILETIFINVATAPTIQSQNQSSQTVFRIFNSDLTLGDEISGSLIRAPNANISLFPSSKGVGCKYDFELLARGENLYFSGECLYKTANEKIDLLVNFNEVRPALLTEILPQFIYFTPLEVRLSGNVQLELDKLLTVHHAAFDLTSEKGTLEIIDYFGKNLEINTLHIAGKALNNFSHIELDNFMVDLTETKAEANALFLRNDDSLDIKVNVLFKGTSISKLLPRWFAYLENEDLKCIHSSSKIYSESSLSIDGTYDLNEHQINALGRITCLDKILSDNNTKPSVNAHLSASTHAIQRFRMDGTFKSPNLATIH